MKQQIERLGKSVLIYGVGRIVSRFIGFLLLPLFTAYLTPTDYGISGMLAMLSFVVTPVFSLGMGAGIGPCYFEGDNQERKETTIWTASVILIASATILVIVALVFDHLISIVLFQTSNYYYLVRLSLITSALGILVLPGMLYLQFEERAKTFVVLTTASTLIVIGFNVLLVVGFRRGIQGLVESGLIAQVISFIIFSLSIMPKLRFRFNWVLGRELLHLSLPLVPSFAFIFVLQQGNKYILQWFSGLDVLGVYSIGFNLGLVMNLAVSAFQSAWYPYFMSFIHKQDEARRLFGRILTYYVFGFGTLNLLFYLFARPVVLLMTQPPFHNAYQVVGLSASAQFFLGVFIILLPGVYFAKETHYQSLVQGIAAGVAIVLNMLFIPTLGLLGAGIALAGGFLAMSVLQFAWNIRRGYLFLAYEWGRIGRFAMVYVGCIALMVWQDGLSLPVTIALSAISTVSLFALIYYLLTNEERQMLVNARNQFLIILPSLVQLGTGK